MMFFSGKQQGLRWSVGRRSCCQLDRDPDRGLRRRRRLPDRHAEVQEAAEAGRRNAPQRDQPRVKKSQSCRRDFEPPTCQNVESESTTTLRKLNSTTSKIYRYLWKLSDESRSRIFSFLLLPIPWPRLNKVWMDLLIRKFFESMWMWNFVPRISMSVFEAFISFWTKQSFPFLRTYQFCWFAKKIILFCCRKIKSSSISKILWFDFKMVSFVIKRKKSVFLYLSLFELFFRCCCCWWFSDCEATSVNKSLLKICLKTIFSLATEDQQNRASRCCGPGFESLPQLS